MNFNKEIKYTHDEIQKLHNQIDELTEILDRNFKDIKDSLVNNEKQKIEVVVKYEHSILSQYTINILCTVNVILAGSFLFSLCRV